MSDVQFEQDDYSNKYKSRRILGESVQPKMLVWLLKIGIVKTEQQGSWVMVGAIVICLLASGYLFFRTPHTAQINHVPVIIDAPGAITH